MSNTSTAFVSCISFLLLIFTCCGKQVTDQNVYITGTGNTYHTHTCRYLGEHSVPIRVNDAVVKEYSPCSDCMQPN